MKIVNDYIIGAVEYEELRRLLSSLVRVCANTLIYNVQECNIEKNEG